MEMPDETGNAEPAKKESAKEAGCGTFLLASLGLNLFLGWLFQSDLNQLIAIGWCCITGLGICIVFGLIGLIGNMPEEAVGHVARYDYKSYGKRGAFFGLVLMTSLASGLFGTIFRESSINDACRYCDTLVVACEEYRAKNGHYPEQLSDVTAAAGRPPWLLVSSDKHSSPGWMTGKSGVTYSPASDELFSFSFGGAEKFWYNSRDKTWYSEDYANSDAPGPHKFNSAQGFSYSRANGQKRN